MRSILLNISLLLLLLSLDISEAQVPGHFAVGLSKTLEEVGGSDARSLQAAIRSIGILHGFHSLRDHVENHDSAPEAFLI